MFEYLKHVGKHRKQPFKLELCLNVTFKDTFLCPNKPVYNTESSFQREGQQHDSSSAFREPPQNIFSRPEDKQQPPPPILI